MAHVVVMDDDYTIRELVQKLLRLQGHTVETFDDAAPVLDMADLDVFDLFVTDLAMPTSGEMVIRTLRKRQIESPILVMSGHVDSEKSAYLVTLGADAVISKPFAVREFIEAVQALLP